MIASDPYLQRFVTEFTETNNGKAFFATLDKLGAFIFRDFESGKRKTVIDFYNCCDNPQHYSRLCAQSARCTLPCTSYFTALDDRTYN
jgi:hypothetical protein